MIIRSTRLILGIDLTIVLFKVVTSLTSARALGPEGRGDLLLINLWPIVIGLLAELGLANAYRFWVAREPERVSRLFSNAVMYAAIAGTVSVVLGYLIVPHLIAERPADVMFLLSIYMLNIPAMIFLSLMRGLLEGTKRFGWAGATRLTFFGVQALGFGGLWLMHKLTVASAAYTMMSSQIPAITLALIAVFIHLHPRWEPSWKEFKNSLHYGLRDYAGGVADFTTLRLDQMMLAGMASSAAIGLYIVAVRLSELTTYVAGAAARALMPEVAATREGARAETLLARTLRLTLYANVLLLIPLWFGAPLLLRILFGKSFVPATGAFRWLLAAAVVWSASAIVISGLQGFGYPGLSTIARFFSAGATALTLPILLPRHGINGAAIASLIGYSVLLSVSLFALLRRRQLNFWRYLRPQRHDIPFAQIRALVLRNWLTARGTGA
jgi:O-antigen/teichoic acid export membrane protein